MKDEGGRRTDEGKGTDHAPFSSFILHPSSFNLRTYSVVPALPPPLSRLNELAYNLWWSWNGDAQELFRRLDPDLWGDLGQNPVQLLAHLAQKHLDQAATDRAYLAHLDQVWQAFDKYRTHETWFSKAHPDFHEMTIAYFSMEFGIHEALPIYSGGLGVLAGDHLKSASDMGLPLVAVGLLYRQGYFQQRLTPDGWQMEDYPSLDFYQTPMILMKNAGGDPMTIDLPIGDHDVTAQIWKVQVGRIPLYLLDTDIQNNAPDDQAITRRLYGGDGEMRIRQEVLLGIGGVRMLRTLGIAPDVCHMNEGHAAFLAVERIRQRMQEDGLDFGEAREAVTPSHVFTTHTPVPAGIDRFDPALLDEYLGPYLPDVGLSLEDFSALGKMNPSDAREKFCMAVLALRLAGSANGVSALHGHVSRELWHSVWPGAPRDEVPITSITNGIHTNTWISPQMAHLLTRYLGPTWTESPENPVDHDVWRRVDEIPDIELWQVHQRRRIALVAYARRRLKAQLRRRGAPPTQVKTAEEVLDPEALTLGFARRFAPYKRGALLFRDPERLLAMINDADRPVQLIFAGKAHPRDDRGKEVIKEVISNIQKPAFGRHIVFLENYDTSVARMLVQGVDIWLNNPVKPREASGTSGMKVPANGGINLSILDGWWPEAYDGENGWALSEGRIHDDPAYRDHLEGEALYDLLEKEIIPMFYDRGADGLPRAWIARMKASMRTICPMFNTNRMIEEYTNRLYVPAARRWRHFSGDGFAAAKNLSQWKHTLAERWGDIRIEKVEANDDADLPVGSSVNVQAQIHLGAVSADDVAIELYHGRVGPHGDLIEGSNVAMSYREELGDGVYLFAGSIPCHRSGQHGYAVRAVPRHPDLPHRYDTGLILWA